MNIIFITNRLKWFFICAFWFWALTGSFFMFLSTNLITRQFMLLLSAYLTLVESFFWYPIILKALSDYDKMEDSYGQTDDNR
jgi:hypothetical protein